jgi:3-keto-5-aminohexanoate cleavage enzyme
VTSQHGPVIIEAALNGITSPRHNPAAPSTPDELARDAIACVESGAGVVHTHADNFGAPVDELTQHYAECYEAVLDAHPSAILYPTVGFGATVAERYAHVVALAAKGLIAQTFLDTGSVNLGGAGPDGLAPPLEYVYTNTFADIRHAFEIAKRHGLGPSIAVFEPGFLQVVLAYHDAGALPAGTLVKLYFAAGGYLTAGRPLWGAPPITEALDLYSAMIAGRSIPWAIAVVGASLFDYEPLVVDALQRGAHLRVGLEDWADGPTNREQVTRAVGLCEQAGRPAATPSETRSILGMR